MRRIGIIVGMLIQCWLLTSCAAKEMEITATSVSPTPVASVAPSDIVKSTPSSTLHTYKNMISDNRAAIEKTHSILIQMLGVGKDHILMQVRSRIDVEHVITEADLAEIKKSIYALAGTEFPVQLSVWACCTGPAHVTGKITSFSDDPYKQILIVNEEKKNGNTNDPEATYIELTSDGILILDGKRVTTGFNKSLVGREVKVWTTGIVNQSYPAQAAGLKVVVE